MRKQALLIAVALVVIMLGAQNACASITLVNANPGGEPDLFAGLVGNPGGNANNIMDTLYGVGNYSRVDDASDQVWHKFDGSTTAVAKYAGDASDLYWSVGGYLMAINVGNNVNLPTGNVSFTWGLKDKSSGDFWSSNPTLNTDGKDHMVTFLITGVDNTHNNTIGNYVIAWEDRPIGGGSDQDYQDAVIEVHDAAPIPEPTTIIIWSLLGGLGLVFAWRRRKFV